jgi:tryptophan synthase alpha chain
VRDWGADGAIVGSALVKVMAAAHASGGDPTAVATAAGSFCAGLRHGIDR